MKLLKQLSTILQDQCQAYVKATLKINSRGIVVDYLRTLFNALLEWITNRSLHSALPCFLYKLIIYTFMYKCTRSSAAALSLQVGQNHDQ